MSELKISDFEGLNVSPFADKVSKVDDIKFLSELEEHEKKNGNRVGAINAINKRQGELLEQDAKIQEALDGKPSADKTIADDEQPEVPNTEADSTNTEGELANTEASKIETPVTEEDIEEDQTKERQEDYEKETVENIRKYRLQLDRALQFSQEHDRVGNECNNDIFMAKAWLGKLLATFGENNPYAVPVKTVADIPPTAEKNEGENFFLEKRQFKQLNSLQAVLALREMLSELETSVSRILPDSWFGNVARTNAYSHICEAKFHLGNELSKLRG